MVSIADVNPYEMIAFTGSRVLEDNTIVFVGTGLPIIASMHAQMTHAPSINLIFEAGSLASILEQGMPLSVGDTRAFRKAVFRKRSLRPFRTHPARLCGLCVHRWRTDRHVWQRLLDL